MGEGTNVQQDSARVSVEGLEAGLTPVEKHGVDHTFALLSEGSVAFHQLLKHPHLLI